MALVIVPDDHPPVISDSPALLELRHAPDVELRLMTSQPVDDFDLSTRINDAHTVINMRGSTRFTYHVMSSVPSLQHIAVWGTATDNIDLESARRLNITVTNTPGTTTDAVAEHTMALALSLARRIPELDARVRAGDWSRGLLAQLTGKTMGIIGTGAIGSQVARLAHSIGMKVIAWTFNPSPKKEQRLGVQYVELDHLIQTADVVSLHVRHSEKTSRIINEQRLVSMKPTALLINTAHSNLVDEIALAAVLQARAIGGAALDVIPSNQLKQGNPLLDLPNVILSPNMAGATAEAQSNSLHMAVENVLAYLAERPQNVVV